MITESLINSLENHDLSLDEFSELVIRLLNYGVLSRRQSQAEQVLYDRYIRIDRLVDEYLSIMQIKLFHDKKFEYIRLYPPGALVPGMELTDSYTSGLKLKLKQTEVALILVLRVQYDKAIKEARVDEQGYVTEKLESVSIALKEILDRSLPDSVTERKELFHKLRQLRLIEFNKDSIDRIQETFIKISPMISSFVNDDALAALENIEQEEEGNVS